MHEHYFLFILFQRLFLKTPQTLQQVSVIHPIFALENNPAESLKNAVVSKITITDLLDVGFIRWSLKDEVNLIRLHNLIIHDLTVLRSI